MLLAQIIYIGTDEGLEIGSLITVVVLLFLVVVTFFVFKYWLRQRLLSDQKIAQKLFLLTVPHYGDNDEQKDSRGLQEQLSKIESFYASLGSMKAQRGFAAWIGARSDHWTLEIIARQAEISFYAQVPEPMANFFVQSLQAASPDVHIQEVEDFNILRPQGAIAATHVTLKRNSAFPIKTFRTFEFDPLEGLTNSLSKMEEGESMVVQYVMRSSYGKWHRDSVQMARGLQHGKSLAEAEHKRNGFFGYLGAFIGGIFVTLKPAKKPSETAEAQLAKQPTQLQVAQAKAIEEKTSKPGLDINIRLLASASNKLRAEALLRTLANAFGQFNIYESGNSFQTRQISAHSKIIRDFLYRRFDEHATFVLNAEECVGLWHLPNRWLHTPNIRWLEARRAAPPSELPARGIILGISDYRGQQITVRMKDDDRRRHMYIIGQTGTGKSNLMEQMIIQDIQNGHGCCLIDPHGDLVEHILAQMPKERAEHVIVFDPSDTARPMGLNMLEFSTPEQKTFVINEMIKILDKLYDLKKTGGPMFEQYLRNTMLLMMEDVASGATLMEVSRVLSDEGFRKYKLSKSTNPIIRDFWLKEAHKAGGEAALANMVPYITSKLTQFIANDIMRPIIAQQQSSFNFRQLMDDQSILLVNLSKGKIGDLNSSLLGLVIVAKILMAALSRVDQPETERKDFYLYIDEFQNFITDTIAVILSEARKYRLNLVVAHQYIAQLVKDGDTQVRDAVFGNVGTKVAYRIGADDAEYMAKEFAPVFTPYDLLNIPKHNAYIKLLIDNQNPPAFNFKPMPPQLGQVQLGQTIKEISRLKYGRPREEVEDELRRRMQLTAA